MLSRKLAFALTVTRFPALRATNSHDAASSAAAAVASASDGAAGFPSAGGAAIPTFRHLRIRAIVSPTLSPNALTSFLTTGDPTAEAPGAAAAAGAPLPLRKQLLIVDAVVGRLVDDVVLEVRVRNLRADCAIYPSGPGRQD